MAGRGNKFAPGGFLKDAQDIARGKAYCDTLNDLLVGTGYDDAGIEGKGAFKKYMDLEKKNNTSKLIDSKTTSVATPAATVKIGATGVYDSTKVTIF